MIYVNINNIVRGSYVWQGTGWGWSVQCFETGLQLADGSADREHYSDWTIHDHKAWPAIARALDEASERPAGSYVEALESAEELRRFGFRDATQERAPRYFDWVNHFLTIAAGQSLADREPLRMTQSCGDDHDMELSYQQHRDIWRQARAVSASL